MTGRELSCDSCKMVKTMRVGTKSVRKRAASRSHIAREQAQGSTDVSYK